MFKIDVAVVAAWLAAGLVAAPAIGRPALAQIIVRTYVTHSVPPRTLATARALANDVLKDAGIDLTWRACDGSRRAPACDDTPDPREVLVRLTAAGPEADAGSLAFSFVDLQRHGGCLATIYMDRVERLARLADVDKGTLLGRTIAHELAHLLLGTSEHSATGLMRATWSNLDLRRDQKMDWTLSKDEAARMRLSALSRATVRSAQRHLLPRSLT